MLLHYLHPRFFFGNLLTLLGINNQWRTFSRERYEQYQRRGWHHVGVSRHGYFKVRRGKKSTRSF
ncbi:MAG: hypothetical protein HY719_12000 [Planctomycetes bacterium]|nr:hypothetical protein [Planctomycetota bacterium]